MYRLMAHVSADMLGAFVFFALTGAKVLRRTQKGFIVLFRDGRRRLRMNLSAEQLAVRTSCLDFLKEPGNVPVRLDRMRKAPAVERSLHGVRFSDYLRLENLYQGFLSSNSPEALLKMAQTLYPGLTGSPLSPQEQLCVLQWTVQIKSMSALLFPNFFRPASDSGETPNQMDVMNAQIRALTGGDVTKEETVLSLDCWRALTELDALALEAQQWKSKHKEI